MAKTSPKPARTRAAIGRASRRKGSTWELEVAKAISQALQIEVKRGIGQTRAGGEVPDVDWPGWWPECKHHTLTNPRAALRQAVQAAEDWAAKHEGRLRVPVAFCKDTGEKPFVVMAMDDFLRLAARARNE